MSSFFDSGPLPDWKDIQRWLGKDIPWNLAERWDQAGDSNWLNQYVKDMMTKSRQETPFRQTQTQDNMKIDAIKDNNYVNVTIRLDPEMDLRHLQLFATSERLKITGLSGDRKRAIRFPCPVYARSGKAVMKKDRLLIRFKRRPLEKSEYELFIQS
ncbi:hypothetical protein [Cohnella silvisoli]|uniref:Hsp20/alpha crystallin family protein n=1 Tax=Cohnella silvisoli TaxID=2873699 RepID=A0ABV1KSU8_9BACL|nr:hypothetical protein [Cohnella silvisoli]MCD9021370.1 hypothetical protein [Cohnella silvisoli]